MTNNEFPDILTAETAIGYSFKDKTLLLTALTHSSYFNENKDGLPCNERLEFLGDAVLSAISAEFLFLHETGDEGSLSRTRAVLVNEDALCIYARELNLGKYLRLGKGEADSGRSRPSTLADAFEAVIAAIYLDGGKQCAESFVLPYIEAHFERTRNAKDYKTILQEVVQKNKGEKLSYDIVSESGPAHNRTFVCKVYINSNCISDGSGKSKKSAEQEAAKNALLLMGIRP